MTELPAINFSLMGNGNTNDLRTWDMGIPEVPAHVPPHTLTIQVKVLMHRSSAQAIL
jgi:hypothetical protein